MAESSSLTLADAEATRLAGSHLATALRDASPAGVVIYLEGDLGAGKTTLARGVIEALGHTGRVPSPTYTLIEPYVVQGYRVYHVDLYRIRDAGELADLDLAAQLSEGTVALVEWPDHGRDQLPSADLHLRLDFVGTGRRLTAQAVSWTGETVLKRWEGVQQMSSGLHGVRPPA
jgi:tRNA threonylcarbamoyladenosine biosynthesis protein TsaE